MNDSHKTRKTQIVSFYPNGEFFYQRGMAFYRRGELEKANRSIERALTFKPNDVEYLCQHAAILSELEQYESSIDILKKIVHHLDDHLTECYFFMANNYAYLGEFDEALDEISTYLTLEPNGVFRDEARELYRLLQSASDEFSEGAPEYLREHERGRLALEHGRFDEAQTHFLRVIAEAPDFLPARNNLSVAFFSMGVTEKAFESAWSVLEQDHGNIHALCNLVSFYHDLGDREQLQAVVRRLDRLSPLLPEHCARLGSAYLYVENYERAYYWLRLAAKRGARCDQVFYYWLALAAVHTGRHELAERSWKRVDYFSRKPFHPFKYGKIQDMLFDARAGEKFMIRDLIKKELWEDNQAYQIFALFYLAHEKDESLLRRVAERGPNALTRSTAAMMLEELSSGRSCGRLQIMREVEGLIGGRKETLKHPELYNFWAVVDAVIDPNHEVDSSGWAGALVYLWRKDTGTSITQKKIAEQAGTTVYRLRKHVRELADALETRWEASFIGTH